MFPKNTNLDGSMANLNHCVLSDRLYKAKKFLTTAEFKRGLKAIHFLKKGAPSYQSVELPPCLVKNAESAYLYGNLVTDTIATWLKKGFVTGPFEGPPFSKFRSNCLMAVEQHEKIRLVLNGSLPENKSFNSNIDPLLTEKVKMSSARSFSYSLLKSGKNSVMSKFDLQDAYKNVNCRKEDFRLQGFTWLGKFFFENRQIFGVKSAVPNFDILGNTLKCIPLAQCDIPRELVHRQLDDTPTVGPSNTVWCEQFSTKYKKLCEEVGIALAPDCPKGEKAFTNKNFGKVLGIFFNSEKLCWSLPEEKRWKTVKAILYCSNGNLVDLLTMQKLVGRINDVSLMCTFLNGFKRNILDDLSILHENGGNPIHLSTDSANDLMIWLGFLMDPNVWHTISPEPVGPTISFKYFISDAAGLSSEGKFCSGPGVASVGFNENGNFIFAQQMYWPEFMIVHKKDEKGVRFGDKSTTLEMIGVILPFLSIPKLLCNQHVVMGVDNIACIHGWENKSLKGEITASIVIRALHLISSLLGSVIHLRHVPRKSDWESNLVDRMSRKKSTSLDDRRLLASFCHLSPPPVLREWICDPSEDWSFPIRIMNFVKSLL